MSVVNNQPTTFKFSFQTQDDVDKISGMLKFNTAQISLYYQQTDMTNIDIGAMFMSLCQNILHIDCNGIRFDVKSINTNKNETDSENQDKPEKTILVIFQIGNHIHISSCFCHLIKGLFQNWKVDATSIELICNINARYQVTKQDINYLNDLLCQIKQNSNVDAVGISANHITCHRDYFQHESNYQWIESLFGSQTMIVSLKNNNIDDDKCQNIATALEQSQSIQTLILDFNNITNQGMDTIHAHPNTIRPVHLLSLCVVVGFHRFYHVNKVHFLRSKSKT